MVRQFSLSGRVVVVSPHLDDAVLSLGATMSRITREGAVVEVVTVFGGDPASTAPANGWDRRAGYENEGAAAAGRREEDREACAIVGARPIVLAFSGGGYKRPREPERVREALTQAVADADAVLVPGFPLTNDDHVWLHSLLLERGLPCKRVLLYAEQPYRYFARTERPRPAGEHAWRRTAARVTDVRTKRRAILAYRSQLPLLGFTARRYWKLHRMLLHELLQGGEAVAELSGRAAR